MEFATLVRSARVAMGIDMHHADGTVLGDGLEERQGDGMVSADRDGLDARVDQYPRMLEDVGMRFFEIEAAAHGDIADIGDRKIICRHAFQDMIVGTDAFDRAQGARPETRTVAVGDAQVHRNAEERHIEPCEIGRAPIDEPQRSAQQRGDAGIGKAALSARRRRFAPPSCGIADHERRHHPRPHIWRANRRA